MTVEVNAQRNSSQSKYLPTSAIVVAKENQHYYNRETWQTLPLSDQHSQNNES